MSSSNLTDQKLSLILASQSPRRKEIFNQLGVPFKVLPSNIEEISECIDPEEQAKDLAFQKGNDITKKLRGNGESAFLVVASDTLVALNKEVLGKPADKNQAREMLNKLRGKKHRVITGVALSLQTSEKDHFDKQFSVETEVEFTSFSSEICERYLLTEDSLDKAGAYGIQGPSTALIKAVYGSYSNVVGFPVAEFLDHCESLFKLSGLIRENESYSLSSIFGRVV